LFLLIVIALFCFVCIMFIPLGISIDILLAVLPFLAAVKTGSNLGKHRIIRVILAYAIGIAGSAIMVKDFFSPDFYWGLWPVVICFVLHWIIAKSVWLDM